MRNCSHSRQFGLSILFFLAFIFNATSQVTWDGGAGTNQWTDADNWSTNQVPQPSENILLVGVDVVLGSNSTYDIGNIQMCCSSTLTIESGSSLTGDYLSIQHAGSSVTNHGDLIINGEFSYGISLGGYTELFNHGNINTYNTGADGAFRLFGATATNNGTITIDGSTGNGDGIHTFNFSGVTSVFTNNGMVIIKNTNGDGISGGGIYHNYGTTDITNVTHWNDLLLDGEDGLGFENYNGALFKGDGQVDPTTMNWNGGEMTTDDGNNTPGIVEFYCLANCTGEDFTNANLIFNIDGTSGAGVANGHDQIQINQNALLGGNIEIILDGAYIPEIGDAFVLMTYNSKTGDDPMFDFPPLPADRQWEYNVGSTELEVSVSALLPVELISFNAKEEDEVIFLNWETASEFENRGFFIEKSEDGINWELLDFIEGHGTSHDFNSYEYEDLDPYEGKNYYRLIQSDFDGTQNKSKTVSVNFSSQYNSDEILIFPNPVLKGNYLHVNFFKKDFLFKKVSIVSESGQTIFHQEDISENMEINVSEFSQGMYFLILENNNDRILKRFIVGK